ncbi:phytanoyl-CoA dioxygenase family protein [Bacillus sp. FJAT-28004]|uniref:phytanoyl-CoA dioxygenase family protein n=1 Tax=Bacillus sp. FJAT-28004 TaxID=1679165 RepID=UPI0006B450F7|nr:phytanoyl-CoA dioxygenase family protein [Bacillus sp. FJAT-28004]
MSINIQENDEINKRMYRYDNVHRPLSSKSDFADDTIRQYREQGFFAVEQILTAEDVAKCIDSVIEIINDHNTEAKIQFVKPQSELRTPEERELAVRKLYNFTEVNATLHAIAYHPVILSIVERLLGGEAKLVQNQALLKPPFGGAEKPWHQDMAYHALTLDQPVVGVWIALDEAGLDNGCMHVIPRSHMDGGIPHYAIRDWQICDANVPVDKDTAIPLQPGGALFFHGLIFHGTPNNLSSKRRRALQFHYAPKPASKMSAGEYKRMFTNEMTSAEC